MTAHGLAGKPLTKREMEVLVGIAEGRSDAAIADELFISPATVKGHLARIKEKVGAFSRPHIVAIAYQQGLLRVASFGGDAERMLLVQAAWHVVTANLGSMAFVVRKLRCTEDIAARLMNHLQALGVVGPEDDRGLRQVYVGATSTVRFLEVLAAIGAAA